MGVLNTRGRTFSIKNFSPGEKNFLLRFTGRRSGSFSFGKNPGVGEFWGFLTPIFFPRKKGVEITPGVI